MRKHLAAFFSSQTAATWVGSLATLIGSVIVLIGLGFTSWQLKLTQESFQATTVYNIEKDFSEIFIKRLDAKFIECYGSGPSNQQKDAVSFDSICPYDEAKDAFFDLLSLYRMLLDLKSKGAIDTEYLNARIRAACDYLASPAGVYTRNEYKRKQLLRADLESHIATVCGG